MSIRKGELFRLSRENLEWFNENYKVIRKECNNQWIIVQNKKIVAKGSTYEEIANALKKSDSRSAIVEYIDSKQLAMFF